MHPHHMHHTGRHMRPHPFMSIIPFFAVFLAFKLLGPFALLLIPAAIVFSKKNREWQSWDWGCDTDDDGSKRKNDEKPKRRVIETADGEYLEVIDEPRRV